MSDLLDTLVIVGVGVVVQGSVFAFTVALAALNLSAFKKYWKTGLLLGVIVFVLVIPSVIFAILHVDPTAMWPEEVRDSPMSSSMEMGYRVGMAVGATSHLVRIPWVLLLYAVAAEEWRKARRQPPPVAATCARAPLLTFLRYCGIGLLLGAVSAAAFHWLHVDESMIVKRYREMFPSMELLDWRTRLPVGFFVLGAAIQEELAFRGAVLAFLIRKSGDNRRMIILSTILVALAWAAAHLGNTSAPLVKVTQIFLIGLLLSAFARRRGLYAAIACHLGLNAAAILYSIVFNVP